jgi:monofunctional biosynthetic peptidoglycan transglycosylase
VRRLFVPVLLVLVLLAGCAAWAAWEVTRYDLRSLARATPVTTALMRQRESEARAAGRAWAPDARIVPYDRISPTLRRAVLIAEDDAFYSHDGLDWNEIRNAARKNLEKGRVIRGGSTITQQLAKNLFLDGRRTLARKLEEAFLAVRLERTLTKRRIFELYLNRIEWGDEIFGAESASWRYFGVSCADLSPRQAVLLAAVIINPRRFSVLAPDARIERRVRIIASRMKGRGYLSDSEYRAAVGEAEPETPHWWWPFGHPAPVETLPPLPPEVPPVAPEDTTASAPESLLDQP